MNRMRDLRLLAAANGVRWTCLLVAQHILKSATATIDGYMDSLENKHNLPGFNSVARNYQAWQNWNWDKKGEEWTVSEQWKKSVIDDVLRKYITPGSAVLEIGPGAGRWTEPLQEMAAHLVVVDLSDKCIELCKQRFAHCNNIEYFVNNGVDLSFIPSDSIDFIWSFDVFVHISPADIEQYLVGFHRILRQGGRGIIHHANRGDMPGAWRSKMTADRFLALLRKHSLRDVAQFNSWGSDGQYGVPYDMVTVFEK